ncbi:hypothetical protein HAZT_HAZT001794 [Hyalella azteca]|uniref:Thymidine kinase n=1 Tax=Hyalella azteca TaxID=294128 RepID=A0A6A0HCL2_HYAAZ|nr:hypothetical protein HAZT_HAZT001794 [Hyalella azteca]
MVVLQHFTWPIIFGPMFSGKTTELMRRIKRYQVAKHKCLVIKYANDIRYDSEQLSTHDHQTLAAVTATTLTGLMEAAHNYSIIGIDEGQFVSTSVLITVRFYWLANSELWYKCII